MPLSLIKSAMGIGNSLISANVKPWKDVEGRDIYIIEIKLNGKTYERYARSPSDAFIVAGKFLRNFAIEE